MYIIIIILPLSHYLYAVITFIISLVKASPHFDVLPYEYPCPILHSTSINGTAVS